MMYVNSINNVLRHKRLRKGQQRGIGTCEHAESMMANFIYLNKKREAGVENAEPPLTLYCGCVGSVLLMLSHSVDELSICTSLYSHVYMLPPRQGKGNTDMRKLR